MTLPKADRIIKTTEVTEGAGVTVHRSIGTPALRNLDPFLMLDHFGSHHPSEYLAGFPDHPHRGFTTFTYMLDGNMEHQDSMGNKGRLTAGSAQWMKAGSGVIHSEMPKQVEGLMRGFQLWINLPAAAKMTEPNYQEFAPGVFPVAETEGLRVKVLLGRYRDLHSPIKDPYTHVHYYDVALSAGAVFEHDIPTELASFIYLYEGDLQIADQAIARHSLAVLGQGDHVSVTAGQNDTGFIVVAGKPIGEPIVQYGPFVMNTQQAIQQAMADYRNGNLVQQRAEVVTA